MIEEEKKKNEQLAAMLEECGLRPSLQRMAVLRYLVEHCTHPTADEIYLSLMHEIPTLSKTTVYNTLKLLVDHGAATMLTIDDRSTCYDGDTSPHTHFFCKRCGRVYDLPRGSCPDAEEALNAGHRVDETHLYFKGVCKKCLEFKTS